MSLSSRRRFLLTLLLPLSIGACSDSSPSEEAARQFMTAYYVNMDLRRAENFTTDLAQQKLKGQVALLDGQSVGPTTQVPTVDISLVKKDSETPTEATYIYEVIPKVPDVGRRKVFVKVRKEGDGWKVTQFTESDQAPSSP